VNLTLAGIDVSERTIYNFGHANYYQSDSVAQLDYNGKHEFAPIHGTFLGFGFMPVSATVLLREIGTINIYTVGQAEAPFTRPYTNTVYALVSLSIGSAVSVNGVTLDVGDHCRAARPLLIKVIGKSNSKPPYGVFTGGPLTGLVTIPQLTGCGVTENLSPLMNATLSGPQNFTIQTQGAVCVPSSPSTSVCPPPKPTPIRQVSP